MGLPVLALSADEVLWALLRCGFQVRARDDQRIVLGRDRRTVSLPLATTLPVTTVTGILRDAGMAYSELLEVLGNAPATPDSPSGSGVRLKRRP